MGTTTTTNETASHNGNRKYPPETDILIASHEDSERYRFRGPKGGIISVPAHDLDQARQLAADEYKGFTPDDFTQVDEDATANPEAYPDPINSDREVNEHDLWMLKHATISGPISGIRSQNTRKNPTENTIKIIITEWDDPSAVPLHDPEALQQADGIGPHKASQIVGAAIANNLIERPTNPTQ